MAAISGAELQDIATSAHSHLTPCHICLPPRCANCLHLSTAARIPRFVGRVLSAAHSAHNNVAKVSLSSITRHAGIRWQSRRPRDRLGQLPTYTVGEEA